VSLGAGLLLTARLIRNSIFPSSAPRLEDLIALNFLNGGILDTAIGADENCELRCQKDIRQ
jgi:hypothetical protein